MARAQGESKRALAAAMLALLAAACTGYTTYWEAGGSFESGRSPFRYAGADRDFRVRIAGNPFDVPQDVTRRAVIAAMQGRDKGMGTNFTTTPRNAYEPWHIVMLFSPTRTGDAACRDPESHTGPGAPGRLSLAALFCYGDKLVYGVGGTRPAVKGPDDPAFDGFVNNLMNYFVPYESMPDEPRDDDGR